MKSDIGVLPIAFEDRGPFHFDFSDLADGKHIAVLAHDADLAVGERGVSFGSGVVAHAHGSRCFSEAVTQLPYVIQTVR